MSKHISKKNKTKKNQSMHESWTELLVFMAEKQPETHHQKRIPGKVKQGISSFLAT